MLTDDEVSHALELQKPRRPGDTLWCRLPEGPGDFEEARRRRCATWCHCSDARRSPRGPSQEALRPGVPDSAERSCGLRGSLFSRGVLTARQLASCSRCVRTMTCPSITASFRVLIPTSIHDTASASVSDRTGTRIRQASEEADYLLGQIATSVRYLSCLRRLSIQTGPVDLVSTIARRCVSLIKRRICIVCLLS